MSWQKLIATCFTLLFFFTPLVWLTNTSELFEFNKIILTYSLAILIGAFWIARMISENRLIFRRTPLDLPILAFLAINVLSLVFSLDPHVSWYGYYSRWNGGVLSLVTYAFLYWSYVSNMTYKNTLAHIRYSVIGAIVTAAYAASEHFGHSFSCVVTTGKFDVACWVQDVQNRVFGTIGQPNWLAAYLTALIFIPISALISPAKLSYSKLLISKINIINFAIFVLLFSVLLFTKSRSGLLAFGVGGAVFGGMMLWKEKTKIFKNYLLFVICGFVIFATLTIGNPVRDLIFKSSSPALPLPASSTQLEVGGTESGAIRKIVWTGAIRIWQASSKNFWLGSGPDTFAMAYYQYRPSEHNQTSEWELLYNKAHNEFLNYLATTGILGLASYLVMLIVMFKVLIPNFKLLNNLEIKNSKLEILALFAGWLTISITNFLGFSVVIVQILLFLLPAMAVTLELESGRVKEQEKKLTGGQWIAILLLSCTPALLLLYLTARYWLADVKYASGQSNIRYFNATGKSDYLVAAYQDDLDSYKLNSKEPVIISEIGTTAAYLANALRTADATSSANLAQLSLQSINEAISISPNHPNYYKTGSKAAILLSDLDPKYLDLAYQYLEKAQLLSPTDPRILFNLGVIAQYQGKNDQAKKLYEASLQLKPDFADPAVRLKDLK